MTFDEILKKAQLDPHKLDEKVKKELLKGPKTASELADKFDVPPKVIEAAVERLADKKHNVKLSADGIEIEKLVKPGNRLVVDTKDFWNGDWNCFGAIADTHLYSKYARLDVLRSLYRTFERAGVKNVYHAGNAIDGECKFNKHDLIGRSGMGAQLQYFAEEYPYLKGIETHFITGDDHEGWYNQREGVNVGEMMQDAAEHAGRKDLKYIGHMESDIQFKNKSGFAWMKIMHPGGGSAYAISYTTQKIVESFQGGEKPQILLAGHYHKHEKGYPREVHTLQPGCIQDQTPFMRKLKLQAMVGGCIVEFHQAPTGEINRFRVEWIPFFDRGFYEKKERFCRW